MQEAQHGHKVIKSEESGLKPIPDYAGLLAKSNEIFREKNREGVSPDLVVKAQGVFMLFNKQLQTKIQYVKMLGAASMAVDNVISEIVPLSYDSILVDIVPRSVRFVLEYKERGITFEIDVLHDDYCKNTNCEVVFHVFEKGKAGRCYNYAMDKISERINIELR